MSTKIKSLSVIVARTLLGLIYFVFGLNFFLNFIPTPPPSQEGPASAFLGGLFQAGYFFPIMKVLEVAFGGLLIAGYFVPLALVVLMPITLNIFLFHTLLTPDFAMAVVILVFHLFVAWGYRDSFKGVLAGKAKPAL
jgi:putative oxidoreductase